MIFEMRLCLCGEYCVIFKTLSDFRPLIGLSSKLVIDNALLLYLVLYFTL